MSIEPGAVANLGQYVKCSFGSPASATKHLCQNLFDLGSMGLVSRCENTACSEIHDPNRMPELPADPLQHFHFRSSWCAQDQLRQGVSRWRKHV